MDLHIDLNGRRGHRDEIYRQIREAVLDGRIRDGDVLPPTRELAQRLTVSRTTVSAAYELLAAEGFLNARPGAGTFVRSGAAPWPAEAAEQSEEAVRPRPEWTTVPSPPRSFGSVAEYDFRAGVPDVRLFPFDTWRRLMTQRLRASQADLLMYGAPQGDPRLREGLARHLGVSRNVRVRPEDIDVTTGVQQTVDLVARVLLQAGDLVAVEDPGYPPPRLLLGTLGMRVAGVPVDGEGIVVEAIPAGTRVVYVTPSHQCPLGVAMSLARRQELLDWGERTGAVVIEDDYDSEFRYTGRPLEPLHSLDSRGRVVYVGSMSKVLSPALRVGFLAAPPSLVGALTKRSTSPTGTHPRSSRLCWPTSSTKAASRATSGGCARSTAGATTSSSTACAASSATCSTPYPRRPGCTWALRPTAICAWWPAKRGTPAYACCPSATSR